MTDRRGAAQGPLTGIRVLELSGMGPGPFCGMLLADMGADVVIVERPGGSGKDRRHDLFNRSKRSVIADLKSPGGVEAVLGLAAKADLLIDPFRPGVTERIGIGPEPCMARNPRLVYGRMTGWGQEGPLAQAAGHDLNYIALTGALDAIGPRDHPVPPLNLVGDFGGGALYLALGLLAALNVVQRGGRGQVVDAAMCDGVASLMTGIHGYRQAGGWTDRRADNLLDGGRPYYDTYRTADGAFVSVAPIEQRFYDIFLDRIGLSAADLPDRDDPAAREELRGKIAAVFLTRTRAEWCDILQDTDACFAPVLSLEEAYAHPHNVAREVYTEVGGVRQPNPAPRFAATPSAIRNVPPACGAESAQCLKDWDLPGGDIERWLGSGAVVQS